MQIVTLDQLRKIAPFSRYVSMQGRQFFKPCRYELLHVDKNDIQHAGLKITKCLQMSAVFTTPAFTDKLARRLRQRFGDDMVMPAWLNALAYQRRFSIALRWADRYAQENPTNMNAQFESVKYAMLAGNVPKAIDVCKTTLLSMTAFENSQAKIIIDILIEAGELSWLEQNIFPHTQAHPFANTIHSLTPPNDQIKTYCISLEQDSLRMSATRHFLSYGQPFYRLHAVYGSALPQTLKKTVVHGNQSLVSDGEIGCALSHLAAWEKVASECAEDEYALITEDDARFIYGPGFGINEIVAAAKARSAGFVFVNMRACFDAWSHAKDKPIDVFRVSEPMDDSILDVGPKNPGWGTDGYILNGETAQFLMTSFWKIGVVGAIDWHIYSMCFDTVPKWLNRKMTRNLYNVLSEHDGWPKLDGYVTNRPIITCRDFGFSTINAMKSSNGS
ncbi:glycosyltransferase family 25 protein [Parasulfitobacter algicola]|uniref:Glycosyltransferase family 25 protein n=1 Tax=Parasulfitobacter algicola TaxID=2614809 RepID=A0ABX2IPJ2_9RHOB|nr:glycosyltransferase family 25 protein [Sulfitobacter algicola]NSX54783.1 glycosyltransferase family 25 protein [Sulfitobacter algicola]